MAAHVALHADKYDHRIFDVSADHAYSALDIAIIFNKITGIPIKTEIVSLQDYAKKLQIANTPDWWIPVAQDLETAAPSGALAITNDGNFKEIVGRPPVPLEMFLEQHKSLLLNPFSPM